MPIEKRAITIAAAVILFVIVSIPINRLIRSSFKEMVTNEEKNKNTGAMPAPVVRLNPEDPSKYGIVVKKEDRIPQDQSDWDTTVKKSFAQSKVLNRIKEDRAFDEVKKTPKELQRKLQRLDDRIKKFEKITKDNPADEDAEIRLQTLYMLKSTLTLLEDKISITPAKNP